MDAPLDESNINRFIRVLQRFLDHSQFIIITHNKRTIGMADVLYGVTMEEHGISKIVSVKFHKTDAGTETHSTRLSDVYRVSVTNSDGADPRAELVLSGNTLYGTASGGGNSGKGTVFSLTVPPSARTDTFSRGKGVSLKIKMAGLLTNDSDLSGDAVTFTGVNLTTTNGVTLATNATYIFYANSNNVNDQFTYTISDSYGGTGTGTGTVLINIVQETGTNSMALLEIGVPGANTNTITFAGIPNRQYIVQFATNLTTSPWFDLATNTAGTNGLWSVIDSTATDQQRFSRVLVP